MEKISFNALTKIIRTKYELIKFHLSERSRRIWAANEAKSIGRGGRQVVKTATGLAFATIQKGMLPKLVRAKKENGMIMRVTRVSIHLVGHYNLIDFSMLLLWFVKY